MGKSRLDIKKMDLDEVKLAVSWAQAEGWNPGEFDAECYYQADPNGFYIGYVADEPVATLSIVKYSDHFAFLGFYIVKPNFRGQGYGKALWDAALKAFEDVNVGLDGVVAQQDNYKQSGFNLAYRNIRFEGKVAKQLTSSSSTSISAEQLAQTQCVALNRLPISQLLEYEQQVFPESRASFWQAWLAQENAVALGLLQNSKLVGVGVIRRCHTGYKVGPLYADKLGYARVLLHSLIASLPENTSYFLDVPELNNAAIELAKEHNMTSTFETARMYTKAAPNLEIGKVFGVTSFEIG